MGFLRKLFGVAKSQPPASLEGQKSSGLATGTGREAEVNNVRTATRKCFVSVSVRSSTPGDESRHVELGEFREVWTGGVSIGSDPACTLVLPSAEVPPVAVFVLAASNHKLLYQLPPGTALPLSAPSFSMSPYDERVDYREFQVGPYTIRFGEVYRNA